MSKPRWAAIVTLFAACIPFSCAKAQKQVAEITGIAHLSFRVSDLDREVAFLGKLGFEESFANVSDGKIAQVFVKVNDRQFIEVYPQTDPSQPLGWTHACYESDSLNALNAQYAARGLKPTPVRTAAAGNLMFSLSSPDGREIEFTQYMPGSRHVLDRGQHLGAGRVSDEIMGFEAPVKDMSASTKFYSSLGFDAETEGRNLRLSLPSNPELNIVLRPPSAGAVPQFLLPVEDARKTAEVLKNAGLKVERNDKLVFVHDPDGNSFVLMETLRATRHHGINMIPWRHKSEE